MTLFYIFFTLASLTYSKNTYSWLPTDWSECSIDNVQSRSVYCVKREKELTNDSFCISYIKPASTQRCTYKLNDDYAYEWDVSKWSDCALNCSQTRKLHCLNVTQRMVSPVSLSHCNISNLPIINRACREGSCTSSERRMDGRTTVILFIMLSYVGAIMWLVLLSQFQNIKKKVKINLQKKNKN